MSLHHRDDQTYADSQGDIPAALVQYSQAKGYPAEKFADAVCDCGSQLFELHVDEQQGVGGRICVRCEHQHVMADGENYIEEAELEVCECLCGESAFEITVGVALYADSEDVRWLYIGGRCPTCGLTGCYAAWKNEYPDYQELLANV